jgi:Tfp pilus assembly PilM family ATPase
MRLTSSLFRTPPPTVAVEIASHRVTAAQISLGGGSPSVTAVASEPLPPGAVVPSLTASNITDAPVVTAALRRLFGRLGAVPRRIGLAVPDSVAKVSLVRFEKLPPKAADVDQLIRFQVRKSAPFRVEEAQVAYSAAGTGPDGHGFVVTLARGDVVRQYEDVCVAAGTEPGLVELSTLNAINAVMAAPPPPVGDWLLVQVTPGYTSIAIVRGESLLFFRHRDIEEEGDLADLVHQTAMYYQDRLGGVSFSRAILAGAAASDGGLQGAEGVRRTIQERLRMPVETIDPRGAAALGSRMAVDQALLDMLAPLLGLLLKEHPTAPRRVGT